MDIANLKTIALNDPYKRHHSTSITEVREGRRLLLKESLFSPTLSGQPNDLGTLVLDDYDEIQVLDVRYEDNGLWHYVSRGSSLRRGQSLTCHLDWDRRLAFMRAHTAAVLVSGLGCRQWECLVSSCNITESHIRVDFSCGYMPVSEVMALYESANVAIAKGYRVSTENIDTERLKGRPELLRCQRRSKNPPLAGVKVHHPGDVEPFHLS